MNYLQVFDNVDTKCVEEVKELATRMLRIIRDIESGAYDENEIMRMHGITEGEALAILEDERAVSNKVYSICGLLLDVLAKEGAPAPVQLQGGMNMSKQELIDRMNDLSLEVFEYTNNGVSDEELDSIPEVIEMNKEYEELASQLDAIVSKEKEGL